MNQKTILSEQQALAAYLILTPLLSLAIPLFLSLPPEIVPLVIAIILMIMAILLTAMTAGRKGES